MARPKKTAPAAPKAPREEGALPASIVMSEPIGWMENGALIQFHQDQVVSNAHDIERLIAHGAQYMEIV